MSMADSPAHRRTLQRQAQLRARFEHLLDSLSLDAFAYPSIKQKPTLIGEVQNGGNCALAAQSGLPAISIPAGFTTDGLPVGLELMGRGFSDVRLVSLAYAFEQAGSRRQRPYTTPVLVAGAAPVATPVSVTVRSTDVTATTTVTYDPVHNELRWSATVAGAGASKMTALVLRRRGGGGTISGPMTGGATGTVAGRIEVPEASTRVVARLLGPGRTTGRGSVVLAATERQALADGRLTVALFDTRGASAAETVIPRPTRGP